MASVARSCLSAARRRTTYTSLASGRSPYSTAQPVAPRDPGQPFRMAIVGSGPAGFYTAHRVMTDLPVAKVDMFEALPVPYGLIRYGVAPDHPEVKYCQQKFEEIALSPNFTFIGNVSVGNPGDHFDGCTIPLASVMRHYDAVLFAYGAGKDKKLGVPGESDLRGIYSAREFVGWYNGLPEFAHLAPDLTMGDEAVIIGQGNAAIDVARMLLSDVDALRKTDMTEVALETLSKSCITRVHVVGRRGLLQAAFSIKEIRELMDLSNANLLPYDTALVPKETKGLPRARRRLVDLVAKNAGEPKQGAKKSWSLDFCLSPTRFVGPPGGYVHRTEFERTSLTSPFGDSSAITPTGELLEIPSSIVFRSIGYKSVALPGMPEAGIAFDDVKGVINNDDSGRVIRVGHDRSSENIRESILPGVYCVGWVKKGATGIIASTLTDAYATGSAIVADWKDGRPFLEGDSRSGWDALRSEVEQQQPRTISWQDWRKIDEAEKERGSLSGKEREKFTSTAEMLSVVAG
ncbi:nucleotide-binding domain-containing protein [Durotheca rogersii]|uniref:nucleotide-binding domain-containing protein n=1 Tax=Durotheca rogersii TaxID=419775 RepID=UPI0022208A5A|nr:nucleotide-binding domain-containing protein [Durotheca rogersii]KAI5868619.1 nucleotide-binding domain-containing protein [Durotheca rogersii]